MKLHRFIINASLSGSLRIRDAELINQLRSVLRLKTGDTIIVCDGSMYEAHATITDIEKEFVELSLGEIRKNMAEPARKVILYLALLKNDHFELALQKATECGVAEIVPIMTDRVVKKGGKEDRWGKVLKEAAEQSGRGKVPLLHETKDFKEAVTHATLACSKTLFLDVEGAPLSAVSSGILQTDSIGLFVGPEGGWNGPELLYIDRTASEGKPLFRVNIGPTTLRAETAAIVGTYIAANQL